MSNVVKVNKQCHIINFEESTLVNARKKKAIVSECLTSTLYVNVLAARPP